MTLDSLLETARRVMPDITPAELAIVAAVWVRIHVDGEPPRQVVRWARGLLREEAEPSAELLRELREKGVSLRAIGERTGLSKDTVARRLSHAAA